MLELAAVESVVVVQHVHLALDVVSLTTGVRAVLALDVAQVVVSGLAVVGLGPFYIFLTKFLCSDNTTK